MAEAVKQGIYKRRHPERTDYYRIIEGSHEEFKMSYPDLFEEKYGYMRAEVMKAIYSFLDCGIPENGMARVRCKECGYDFFVAFSCRCRGVCPSCSGKRSILFGEKIREIIVKPLTHIHITFTIPKILRLYFRRNRKLLKLPAQSANYAVEKYFKESLKLSDGYTGGIYYIHSQGSLYNFHPHVHALVIAGIIKDGIFYEQKNISTGVISEIFRARLLSVLLEEGAITQGLIDMLMTWNHNSGFNVHTKGRIDGDDGEAIEKIARYMSRPAISVDRVEFNPDGNTVIVYEKQDRSPSRISESYDIMEFMSLVAGHIPSPYESLVYYYGIYSSSHRGKEKRENSDNCCINVEKVGGIHRASSAWARLIRKIFEVDILRCKMCGGEMKIIAFITGHESINKILRHIREETIRPPPLKLKPIVENNRETCPLDYIPPVDIYIRDPEYAN